MGAVAGMIAAIAFAVMSIFTAWLLYQLVKTMGITNRFINDVRVETIPLMTRLQTTMDHVNTELERVDGILTALESMSQKANSATKVVQEVVTSPIVKVLGIGAGAGKAFRKMKKK
ncbi:MAG: hypothetical protein CVT63_01670 [Candidatus Anoxymicrobium japonicum]|uniref:DUF948 domain-containing protein n=1 Tax=Candidatus Anoxymicrobium japonicum TaxID=2013648 RepID=A0A2N3G7E0_9ACTN|nr:MAG: hypothetical protein CVT63_01670 [Candidatus Anoxymicrobium japonicum]